MKVLSQPKTKQLSKPWITRGIKTSIRRLKIDYLLPVTILDTSLMIILQLWRKLGKELILYRIEKLSFQNA